MAWKPLETRPHHVSGARGDSGAGASHRTVQAWMDSREKQPGKGPQNPRTKRATTAGKSGPTAGKKSIANCRQTTNNHHSYRGPPDTDLSTRWQRRQAKQHRGADGSDSAQRSEAEQSQFIEETIEIPILAQRQTGFRRSWKFFHYSAMMRRSSSGPQFSEDCGDVAA